MKTVMKKIFSLMLVAVLLVSAVPFAASASEAIPVQIWQNVDGVDQRTDASTTSLSIAAVCSENGITGEQFEGAWVTNGQEYKKGYDDSFGAESTLVKIRKKAIVTVATCENCGATYKIAEGHTCPPVENPEPAAPIKIVVKVDASDNVVWEGTKVPANGEYALVENLLTYCWNKSWDDVYTFSHAYRYGNDGTNGKVAGDAQIFAGEEVHIMVKSVPTDSGSNNSGSNNGGVNDYYGNEALKDLWLYIYTNKNMTEPAKRIQISGHLIGYDGVIEKGEVLSIIDDYYKATDSSKGIIWKGMYLSSATTASSNMTFVSGQLYDTLYGVTEERYKDVTVIMARVDGVGAINSYTADSSNPKTGDMIMAPVAVLGLSASALAVLFFLNKKRAF